MAQKSQASGQKRNKRSGTLSQVERSLLFHADNMACMNYLINQGFENSIALVYIDPPFLSGERYFRRVKNSFVAAFDDNMAQGKYLEMLRLRLELVRKLLSPGGSVFI